MLTAATLILFWLQRCTSEDLDVTAAIQLSVNPWRRRDVEQAFDGKLQSQPLLGENHTSISHVHLASTACGSRAVPDFRVMAKSVALSAKKPTKYTIHVLTDQEGSLNSSSLQRFILAYKYAFNQRGVYFKVHVISSKWRYMDMFRRCATARIHLPSILPLDSIIYTDADTLWQVDPYKVQKLFQEFTTEQSMGFGLDGSWWYKRQLEAQKRGMVRRTVSFWGSTGLNSGVMLWNLTRARIYHEEYTLKALLKSGIQNPQFKLGDQDALNMYLHRNPLRGHEIPCQYNLRQNTKNCSAAVESKEAILHGNKGVFHHSRLCVHGRLYVELWKNISNWRMSREERVVQRWPSC